MKEIYSYIKVQVISSLSRNRLERACKIVLDRLELTKSNLLKFKTVTYIPNKDELFL